MAMDPLWIHSLSYTPLLRYCDPLATLLVEYYPDGVGISPTTVSVQRNKQQQQLQQQQQQRNTADETQGEAVLANGKWNMHVNPHRNVASFHEMILIFLLLTAVYNYNYNNT